jgi:hypothetical protein
LGASAWERTASIDAVNEKAVGGADPPAVLGWEVKHGQSFREVRLHPGGQFRSALRILLNQPSQVRFGRGSIGRIEDRANIGSHFLEQTSARHISAGILLQMELVSILAREWLSRTFRENSAER